VLGVDTANRPRIVAQAAVWTVRDYVTEVLATADGRRRCRAGHKEGQRKKNPPGPKPRNGSCCAAWTCRPSTLEGCAELLVVPGRLCGTLAAKREITAKKTPLRPII